MHARRPICAGPGLDLDTARKLNILRGALVLRRPQRRARGQLNEIATRLQSTYGKGRARITARTSPATMPRR
jgi:peptidyl-dipeptidase A